LSLAEASALVVSRLRSFIEANLARRARLPRAKAIRASSPSCAKSGAVIVHDERPNRSPKETCRPPSRTSARAEPFDTPSPVAERRPLPGLRRGGQRPRPSVSTLRQEVPRERPPSRPARPAAPLLRRCPRTLGARARSHRRQGSPQRRARSVEAPPAPLEWPRRETLPAPRGEERRWSEAERRGDGTHRRLSRSARLVEEALGASQVTHRGARGALGRMRRSEARSSRTLHRRRAAERRPMRLHGRRSSSLGRPLPVVHRPRRRCRFPEQVCGLLRRTCRFPKEACWLCRRTCRFPKESRRKRVSAVHLIGCLGGDERRCGELSRRRRGVDSGFGDERGMGIEARRVTVRVRRAPHGVVPWGLTCGVVSIARRVLPVSIAAKLARSPRWSAQGRSMTARGDRGPRARDGRPRERVSSSFFSTFPAARWGARSGFRSPVHGGPPLPGVSPRDREESTNGVPRTSPGARRSPCDHQPGARDARRRANPRGIRGEKATAPEIALGGRCLLTPLAISARRKK
jgi:hypothetical protein